MWWWCVDGGECNDAGGGVLQAKKIIVYVARAKPERLVEEIINELRVSIVSRVDRMIHTQKCSFHHSKIHNT